MKTKIELRVGVELFNYGNGSITIADSLLNSGEGNS